MALPAGRYGVTRNQLNKIRNLPKNTIEMITDIQEGTARIENGTKPEATINAGEQFWHGSVLYTATADITTSDNIVTSGVGANCIPSDPITEQIADVIDELEKKCDNSVIAPVEDGLNASQDYALGSHFIRGGKFCTVTTAMAQGDAIAGKYSEGNVADELKIVESTATLYENNIGVTLDNTVKYVKKYGKLIQVYCRFNVSTAQTVSALTSIIDTGYPTVIDVTKLNVITRAAPYAPATFSAHLTPSGTIALPKDAVLAAQGYDVYGVFLTK